MRRADAERWKPFLEMHTVDSNEVEDGPGTIDASLLGPRLWGWRMVIFQFFGFYCIAICKSVGFSYEVNSQ